MSTSEGRPGDFPHSFAAIGDEWIEVTPLLYLSGEVQRMVTVE